MSLLIRNGTVVNNDSIFKADVLVRDGIIQQVAPVIEVPEDVGRVIDASNKYVIPGGIDPHTHMEEPFMNTVTADDFYDGTCAAVSGGTTMIIDFAFQCPERGIVAAYNDWRGRADPKVVCDYGLSMVVRQWDEKTAKEMEMMVSDEYGINSFKFFMAFTGLMIDDAAFYRAMLKTREIGALARVHAEHGPVILQLEKELLRQGITGPEGHSLSRPESLQEEATYRACVLARETNCPLYVVHVMSKKAAEVIIQHRAEGNIVFGEAVSSALALDGSHYFKGTEVESARYIVSPPLSTDSSTAPALMDYLAHGVLQLTGSDNCTFNSDQKMMGCNFTEIPNGVNGVEDRMSIVWEKGVNTGKIDPLRFVDVTSTTAAKIFNIYPQKGRIAAGSDADIVIWDPEQIKTISAKTHHHNLDYNIFEGIQVKGVADITISRGNVVWENNKLNVVRGSGKFVKLPPFSPHFYHTLTKREDTHGPIKVKRSKPVF